MIDTRIVRNASDTKDVCETYSQDGFKLRQIETGIIYGKSVIDEIAGMNGDKPFSRFTYEETDEPDLTEDESLM